MGTKKLYRKSSGQVIGGVCAGLEDYFNIDKVIIRLVWSLAVIVGGIGLLAYLIAWIIIPIDTARNYQ